MSPSTTLPVWNRPHARFVQQQTQQQTLNSQPEQENNAQCSDISVETTKLLQTSSVLTSSTRSVLEEGCSYNTLVKDHSSKAHSMAPSHSTVRHGQEKTVSIEQHRQQSTTLCSPSSLTPPPSFQLNPNAVHFGIRMAVGMTISSFFSLWHDDDLSSSYPQAMWVLITVLFVTWFPNGDAASVVEKSLQRIYGTFIGAMTGIACGCVSLQIVTYTHSMLYQAIFLATCIALYTFVICWVALQYKVRVTQTSILGRYNYACILCLLTFYICLLPFYDVDDSHHARWRKALYRVMNVLVGCVLGALLSMAVLPRSTVHIVQSKMERQVQLAGQASRAVLCKAAQSFATTADAAQHMCRHSSQHLIVNDNDEDDHGEEALRKQETAIQESRVITSQLGMFKYDPFSVTTPDEVRQAFSSEVKHCLARALRIQHTVVLLDGIVRNDPQNDFEHRHTQLFSDIGNLIHDMLVLPSNSDSTGRNNPQKSIAYKELERKLAEVRHCIVELSGVVAQTSREMPADQMGKLGVGILGSRHNLASMWQDDEDDSNNDDVPPGDLERVVEQAEEEEDDDPTEMEEDHDGRGAPKFVHGSRVCALLFLQLVEHLALRSVRLYQSWKHCEYLCNAAQHQEEIRSSWRHSLKARYYESR